MSARRLAITLTAVAAISPAVTPAQAAHRKHHKKPKTHHAVVSQPTNVVPPVTSGTPAVGATLSCDPGSWKGGGHFTFTFAWVRIDSTGWSFIDGANGPTYTLTPADAGTSVHCLASADNAAGTDSEDSNALLIPLALP